MFSARFWRKWGPYLLLLAAALVAMRQWRHPALLSGHSAAMDFARQVVFDSAVREGDWWPRFNDGFYYSYGSMLFHFYAPFSYFMAEGFLLAGFNLALSLKLAWALALLLSGVFAIWLARDLFGDWGAAAAGPLYVLAPYHLCDMHVRHAYGESIAFTWLPLALWGLLVAVRDRRFAGLTAAALGVAGLLLTHNISAMLAAPVLFAWWVFLTIREYRIQNKEYRMETEKSSPYSVSRILSSVFRRSQFAWRGSFYGAAGVLLGAALAAFFWVPAFFEKDMVWSLKSLTVGFFDYHRHFPRFRELFDPSWKFGDSNPGPKNGMPFQLGLAHWVLLAGLPFAIALSRRMRAATLFFAGMLAWALLMTLRISEPLWEALPTLPFVQFPWRFMLFATLAATMIAAAVAQLVAEIDRPRLLRYAVAPLIALPFFFYFGFGQVRFMVYSIDHNPRYTSASWEDVSNRIKSGWHEYLYNTRGIDWVRDYFNRGTSEDDYLPVEVHDKPGARPENWIEAATGRAYYQVRERPSRYWAMVQMTAPGPVVLNRFWYPGWRAWVDDVERPPSPYSDQGLVAATVPAGEHRVRFVFDSTPLRRGAWATTVAALLVWLGLWLFDRRLGPGK